MVLGAGGINQSTNGGTSWTPSRAECPTSLVNAMVATPSAVYAALNIAGLSKLQTEEDSWTNTDTGLWSSSVSTLVKDPPMLRFLYAAASASGLNSDAFVTKLNPSGSGLLFSTLIGGSKEESGNGIAVDANGNIMSSARRSLSIFLLRMPPLDRTFTNNCTTGFVTKLNPAVPSYTFSTYLGGGQCDVREWLLPRIVPAIFT